MTDTTATWGSGSLSFTSGQKAVSDSIDKNNGTITEATLTSTESSGTFKYFMTAHGNDYDGHTEKNGTITTEQSQVSFTTGNIENYSIDMVGQIAVVSQLSGSSTVGFGLGVGNQKIAQSFVYPTYTKTNLIRVKRATTTGTPTGNVVVSIQADLAGNPSGTDLVSRSLSLASWNNLSTSADGWIYLEANSLTPGNTYWLIFSVSSGLSNSNYYNLIYDNSGVYGSLKSWSGFSWNLITGTLRFGVETAGYIDLGSTIDLTYNSFSISWWMKRDTNNYECIFANSATGSSGQVEIDKNSNKLRFESLTNGVDQLETITTGITTSDGAWHHYVLVSGASDFKLYVDGVQTYSRGSALTDTATQKFRYIGKRQNSPNATYGEAFNGQLDEIRFYSIALDSTQVATLYAGDDLQTSLLYRYSFEEGSGTKVYDNTIFESVVSGTSKTFMTSGTDLRWKVHENAGSTGTITNLTIGGYH